MPATVEAARAAKAEKSGTPVPEPNPQAEGKQTFWQDPVVWLILFGFAKDW
nr:hypothetical protein [uncultured bacterium]